MGWLSSIAKGAGSIAKTAIKSPLGKVAGLIPGVSTAINAASLGMSLYDAFAPSSSPSAASSMMPTAPRMGLAPLNLGAGSAGVGFGGAPTVGTFGQHGASATAKMKTSATFPTDMAGLQALEHAGIIIPFSSLRMAHKSPDKHFAVVHVNGVTVGMRKDVARKAGLWKASAKPPIKASEMHALNKAHRVVKKLQHIEKKVNHVARGIHKRHSSVPAIAHHKKRK